MNPAPPVLVVEDDPICSQRLASVLTYLGHEVTQCRDGREGWARFETAPFPIVITDWLMPHVDGLELTRRIRAHQQVTGDYTYVLLVTGMPEGLVEGLEAGADEFVFKPVRGGELRARLQSAVRVLGLEAALRQRVRDLEAALTRVRRLEGLLPICSYCKNIRQETQEWTSIERYVSQRSEASFSHSICPTCYDREVAPELAALEAATQKDRGGRQAG